MNEPMHSFIRAGGPFALAGLALAAHAQPNGNVTLYGIVDAYVETVHGAATLGRVQSGSLSGSRFGIKGQRAVDAAVLATEGQCAHV
jgi:predicted porin